MSASATLETALASALRRPGAPAPAGVTPPGRLDIHRNNIHVSLVEALREAYPVTERLVGEAFFHAMARTYVADELPDSPVLLAYGAGFPAFIETFRAAAGLPYLPDVARLERARLEAY
ncbi:DNA-binding domain-containing protein, partial [Arhodomonas sp. KWT]